MLFPSVIGWGKERLSFSDSSRERRKSSRHPENAVHQGSLAESNFLIPSFPVSSRSDDLSRPRAMQFRQKLQNGDIARVSTSADFIRAGHEGGPVGSSNHALDNASTLRRDQSRKMGSCRSCLHGASRWQLIVAVRLEAEGCGEHWPVHVDIQAGTWSADIEVQAAKSGM
jgi:hypothetical protein